MLRFVEGNWGLGRMGNLAMKAGCTMILTVSLQFAKHVFGVDRFQICGTTREKAIFHTCPICSGYNISLIAIANDIFRKKEVDKMSCVSDIT
ncbi:MAG: hypothetical protein WAZ77_00560 [Candidatus Nitrosopolaris sp.]|jgi:hypothetical protein